MRSRNKLHVVGKKGMALFLAFSLATQPLTVGASVSTNTSHVQPTEENEKKEDGTHKKQDKGQEIWELQGGKAILSGHTLTLTGTAVMDFTDPTEAPWYEKRASIHEILVEEGIVQIGDYAFADCSNLIRIQLPKSLQGIGKGAFRKAVSLQKITFPEYLVQIEEQAFYYAIQLSEVALSPETNIAADAFSGCYQLPKEQADAVQIEMPQHIVWLTLERTEGQEPNEEKTAEQVYGGYYQLAAEITERLESAPIEQVLEALKTEEGSMVYGLSFSDLPSCFAAYQEKAGDASTLTLEVQVKEEPDEDRTEQGDIEDSTKEENNVEDNEGETTEDEMTQDKLEEENQQKESSKEESEEPAYDKTQEEEQTEEEQTDEEPKEEEPKEPVSEEEIKQEEIEENAEEAGAEKEIPEQVDQGQNNSLLPDSPQNKTTPEERVPVSKGNLLQKPDSSPPIAPNAFYRSARANVVVNNLDALKASLLADNITTITLQGNIKITGTDALWVKGTKVIDGTGTIIGANSYQKDSTGVFYVAEGQTLTIGKNVTINGNKTAPNVIMVKKNAILNIYGTVHSPQIVAYDGQVIHGDPDSIINVCNGARIHNGRLGVATIDGYIHIYDGAEIYNNSVQGVHVNGGRLDMDGGKVYNSNTGVQLEVGEGLKNGAWANLNGGFIYNNTAKDVGVNGGHGKTSTCSLKTVYLGLSSWTNDTTYGRNSSVGGLLIGASGIAQFNGKYGRIYNNHKYGIRNEGGQLTIAPTEGTRIIGRSDVGIWNSGTAKLSKVEVFEAKTGIINTAGNCYFGERASVTECNAGGVKITGGAFHMNDGTIYRNNATVGAGVYVEDGTFNLTGGNIRDNIATDTGGGVEAKKSFTMSGGAIYGNKAKFGAGVRVRDRANFNFSNGSIYSNVAYNDGGGIYLSDGGKCIQKGNSQIRNNTAAYYGGGVCVIGSGSTYTLHEGNPSVHDNTATSTTASGGGICVLNNGSVSIEKGQVRNNKSSQYGGGISIIKSTSQLQGGSIYDNTGTKGGGGVYNNGTCHLSGTAIESNRTENSTQGNGVYNEASATLNMSGAAHVNQNNAVYLAGNSMIHVTGGLTYPSGTVATIIPSQYILGKQVVSVDYGNKTGRDVLYYANDQKRFALSSGGAYQLLRESNDVNNMADHFILISKAYTVAYDKNTTETVTGMPQKQTKYWNEDLTLKVGQPVRYLYLHKGWSTDKNVTSGSAINGNVYRTNADITYYAIWKIKEFKIHYDPNGGSGKTKTNVTQNLFAYEILSNKETKFAKENASFRGWSLDPDVFDKDVLFRTDDLPCIVDVTKVDSVPEGDRQVIHLYAIWDDFPDIVSGDTKDMLFGKEFERYFFDEETGMETIRYYEGEKPTKADILSNVKATDREDDIEGKELEIKIASIVYSDRKLVEEYVPGQSINYKRIQPDSTLPTEGNDDIPDDFILDTWMYHLDKTDESVEHQMTLTVTDSVGNKTEEVWNIQVLYNEFPTIDARDRFFLLGEALEGLITYNELLKYVSALDAEDGTVTNKVEILNYDPESYNHIGIFIITYKVVDSLGKQTIRSITMKISENQPEPDMYTKYVRYINSNYFLYGNGEPVPEEDGGLNERSIWLTDESYKNALKEALNNKKDNNGEWVHVSETWYFTKKEIEKIKEHINTQGIVQAFSPEGLDSFLEKFSNNKIS